MFRHALGIAVCLNVDSISRHLCFHTFFFQSFCDRWLSQKTEKAAFMKKITSYSMSVRFQVAETCNSSTVFSMSHMIAFCMRRERDLRTTRRRAQKGRASTPVIPTPWLLPSMTLWLLRWRR